MECYEHPILRDDCDFKKCDECMSKMKAFKKLNVNEKFEIVMRYLYEQKQRIEKIEKQQK